MQAKEFQQRALDRLDLYLEKLREAKSRSDAQAKLAAENPDVGIQVSDFTIASWEAMAGAGEVGRAEPYSRRRDGMGNPVPCVTLKIPTGGGKTFLAVHGAAKILDKYFAEGSDKFVLWIVPSEAIYSQTKSKLVERDHPFRKLLDIASGGRVQILEKDSPLNRHDLKGTLTVMLLMLPSANRQDAVNKLRLFRDRGNVNGFLPSEDDQPAHEALKEQVPNLDYVDQGDVLGEETGTVGMIRSSMGNALRMIRPLVVMDEGHKAFSDLAHQTLYGFNPRFVLELSATPKDGTTRKSNWLVNVTGIELDAEEMIKMPMIVTVTPKDSWKDCLREAWQQVESLQAEANKLEENTGRYIRPILLVQVERTGGDQMEAGFVHAEHVREYLQGLGVSPDAIAVKSSETDELKSLSVPNLLDRECPIRAIITKQALQEGWDCPFAYVLCSLAVSRSASAMTQLVGRILRQPHVSRTGVAALDNCYVYTYHQRTGEVVEQIRKGLKGEGMGDLAVKIVDTSSTSTDLLVRERREPFRKRTYYLPQVLVYEGDEKARELDWETDILGAIDWSSFTISPPSGGLPKGDVELLGGVRSIDMSILAGGTATAVSEGTSAAKFDPVFAVRSLMDHVPNPWIAQEWVDRYIADLKKAGWTEQELAERQQYVIREMLSAAGTVIEEASRHVFDEGLEAGRIAFHLIAEKWWPNWEVPRHSLIEVVEGAKRQRRDDDNDFERNLFDPLYPAELNGLELKAACFLDRQSAVTWWYRNLVRSNAYGLQGWRRHRIYPDLIFAQEKDGDVERWVVIETKGDHLSGNIDSEYKKDVFEKLTEAYPKRVGEIGQLTLFEKQAEYRCVMVMEASWERELKERFTPNP